MRVFEVDERQFLGLLLTYLREKGCFEAVIGLVLETNGCLPGLPPLTDPLLALQRLVLQGRWDDVQRLLQPVCEQLSPSIGSKVLFLVLRQRFLEALSWQGGGGERWIMPPWKPMRNRAIHSQQDEALELDDLIAQLNHLKPLCTVQQFNSLCLFLTLERLDEHPEYQRWSVAEGRVKCMEDLVMLLGPLLLTLPPAAHELKPASLPQLLLLFLSQAQPTGGAVASLTQCVLDMQAQEEEGVELHWSHEVQCYNVIKTVPQPLLVGAVQSLALDKRREADVVGEREAKRPEKPRPSSVSWTVEVTTPTESRAVPAHLRKKLGQEPDKLSPDRKQREEETMRAALATPSTAPGDKPIAGSSGAANRSRPGSRQATSEAWHSSCLYEANCPLRCVASVGISEGRQHVAIGTNAKQILVIDYEPREGHASLVRTLESIHKGSVYAMDYSPGFQLLATGSNDKYVKLISPWTGNLVASMKGHTGTVRAVAFGNGQPTLASAGAGDCRTRLWDVPSQRCQRILQEHPAAVHGMQWISDHVLVTGCEEGHVILHDLRCEAPVWTAAVSNLAETGRGVFSLAAFGDCPRGAESSVIAIGSGGGWLSLWDLGVRKQIYCSQIHKDDIRAMSYDSITRRLLTASYDGTAQIKEYTASSELLNPLAELKGGHSDKILMSLMIAEGKQIITTGADGRALLWKA